MPSGASIASLELCIRYKPQDGLNMMTQGGECIGKIYDGRSEGKLFPTYRRSSSDQILNAGSGYNPLSTIEDIPHAYTTPSSVKTNYSRRWRGMQGVVRGPFDVDMFGFGFENPHVDTPFKLGYYDFTKRDAINPTHFLRRDHGTALMTSGTHVEHDVFLRNGDYHLDVDNLKNIGWRFTSGNIFQDHHPEYSTSYKTTDWTALSSGSYNFQHNELYGKIADAFDAAVRVSGQTGGQYIDVSPDSDIIDTSGGFSVFVRFTPDANVSGVDYNLYNSGVIFSKWETANSLAFALGYESGYLTAYAKDLNDNVIKIQDT